MPGQQPTPSAIAGTFKLVLGRRWQDAVAAASTLVSNHPQSADAWNLLGLAAAGSMELTAAAEFYRKALALDPEFAEAYNNLGSVLAGGGQAEDGFSAFRRALKSKPGYPAAFDNLLLAAHCCPSLSPGDVTALHAAWGRMIERDVRPLRAEALAAGERPSDGRLRIGYVSADFKQHSVAWFLEPVLAHHDHERVHVTAYANLVESDDVTKRMRGLVDRWCDVSAIDDTALAKQVVADGIEVLVDLSGHTAGHRLGVFARQPAPVQLTWLGYPATTGLTRMSYRLTDEWSDPIGGTESFHTETLVRLPAGFLCYAPGALPAIVTPPPSPSGTVTFGCFNDLAKIGPTVLDAWATLLAIVPNSRLLLKARALADAGARARVAAAFAARGIPAERVQGLPFAPTRDQHLALYGQVDVALDTFPYNGTTTTCEALVMGVPVVTVAGASHAARVSVSLLHQIGLDDLVAGGGVSDYVAVAARLAADPDRRTALRTTLRERVLRSPLCDAGGFTRKLESAYEQLARRPLERSR